VLASAGTTDPYLLPDDRIASASSVDIGSGAPARMWTVTNERRGVSRVVLAWDLPVRTDDGVRAERVSLVVAGAEAAADGSQQATSGGVSTADATIKSALVELARALMAVDGTAGVTGEGAR
jgi:hypothetical protein